jgi:hypothetical protein
MKKFLQNIVKLKKISTIKDFRFGTFPVRVRVTLFTDHQSKGCSVNTNRNYSAILATLQITGYLQGSENGRVVTIGVNTK